MQKTIAIIDSFVKTPEFLAFNNLVEAFNFKGTYHSPSFLGMETLYQGLAPHGIIVLGSASHIHENLPWQLLLKTYLREKLEQNIPVLGICFGHQLLADVFGSKVGFHTPEETILEEVRPICFTKSLLGFSAGRNLEIAFRHAQIIHQLGDDLVSVASSAKFQHEIITHRTLPFIGIQGHPEKWQGENNQGKEFLEELFKSFFV